jgi:hypothetical protein
MATKRKPPVAGQRRLSAVSSWQVGGGKDETLSKATSRAARGLGLTAPLLAKLLGVDEDSALLLLEGGLSLKEHSHEGLIARELIRIFVELDRLVGHDESSRLSWLASANKAFDEHPLTLIQTSDGRSRMIEYLDLMRQSER